MKKGISRISCFAILTTILMLLIVPARGDAIIDWDFDNGLDPATVVIGSGDTVTWQNLDLYGFSVRITFDAGLTFNLQSFHQAGVIFTAPPGVYNYHTDWGEGGAVIVNVAPTVTITTPTNTALFAAPATFTVEATASDTVDDYVSDVEFFLGTADSTNSIEDVLAPPFTTGLTNLAAGNYTLLAVARDSRGWTATNAIAITVAAPGSVNLSSPRFVAGKFLFDASGLLIGKTNIIQASTNLVSWLPVKTNIAASAAITVTNNVTALRLCFRILQLP